MYTFIKLRSMRNSLNDIVIRVTERAQDKILIIILICVVQYEKCLKH